MRFWDAQFCFLSQMKKHKRLLLFQWKYTKTPMSKFECFGHAVKGQSYHVKIMVSNAIPLLFGNYDAHIMYMWDIHLKKVLKNVNYIKREFTDTHTNTLSPSPSLYYFIIITFDSFAK